MLRTCRVIFFVFMQATINMEARGNVEMLQAEIKRLNTELDNLRRGYTDPMVAECKELREHVSRSVPRQMTQCIEGVPS